MSTAIQIAQEAIRFRRPVSTPGFHMMDAEHSPREWRVVSHLFYVVVFETWRGHISLGGNRGKENPVSSFANGQTN